MDTKTSSFLCVSIYTICYFDGVKSSFYSAITKIFGRTYAILLEIHDFVKLVKFFIHLFRNKKVGRLWNAVHMQTMS